jgi:hypothetical protein
MSTYKTADHMLIELLIDGAKYSIVHSGVQERIAYGTFLSDTNLSKKATATASSFPKARAGDLFGKHRSTCSMVRTSDAHSPVLD